MPPYRIDTQNKLAAFAVFMFLLGYGFALLVTHG